MANEEGKYDGDYKIGVSDKGRVSFDLNWKWLVGIAITVLGFIFWLLIDKYHTAPMNDLKNANTQLKIDLENEKKEREKDRKIITSLSNVQLILVDRTERTETFMLKFVEENGGFQVNIPSNLPDIPHNDVPNSGEIPNQPLD